MPSITHRAACTKIGIVYQHIDEHGDVVTHLRGFEFDVDPRRTAAQYPPDVYGWELSDLMWAQHALDIISTL